jgi:hypothetical protein
MAGKITLSGKKLLDKLAEFQGNKSMLAREFDVSVAGMSKAITKAQNEVSGKTAPAKKAKPAKKLIRKPRSATGEAARAAGKAAALVVSPKKRQSREAQFNIGINSQIADTVLLENMGNAMEQVKDMGDTILAEIKKTKGMKPFQFDLYLKFVKETRGLTGDYHKIKKDMYEKAAMQQMLSAVLEILKEEMPDVQERIFIKLRGLSLA